jgi:hypothetical protein
MPSNPIQTVLLDMGGVILRMAGGHGFPHLRLDWRGRQAMLQTMAKGGSKVSLEDLEAVVFAPWHAEYNRREEMGKEASWSSWSRGSDRTESISCLQKARRSLLKSSEIWA